MKENDKKWYEIVSKTENTIEVLFLKSKEKKVYQIVTLDQIREKVKNEESINLDNCYVKDFSVESVCAPKAFKLKGFRASNSFFDGDVSFRYAVFDGGVRFDNAVFGNGEVSFKAARFINGEANFKATRFGYGTLTFEDALFNLGDVNFRGADFNDGDVSFHRTWFGKGNLIFSSSLFGDGNVIFTSAGFEGNAFFTDVRFGIGNKDFQDIRKGNGETQFIRTDFGDGDVTFYGTNFGGGIVSFRHAKFGMGDIDFSYVCFGGDTNINEYEVPCAESVDFRGVQFGEGDILFNKALFGKGGADFSNSYFGKGRLVFDHAVFGNKDIKFIEVHKSGGELTFRDTNIGNGGILFDSAIMENSTIIFDNCIFNSVVSLNQCKISKLAFSNCTNHDIIHFGKQSQCIIQMIAFFYHNNMGTILLNWDIYKKPILNFRDSISSEVINGKEEDLTEPLITSELKMLKENYHNQGEYKWEDEAYVEFKRLETKQLPKKTPKRWILSFVDLVGKFGTDPWSVFVSMIIAVFVFGLLYLLPWMSIYPENAIRHIWSPFYYSLITFLTIGYGDLSAQNWLTALICGIEGFLGVFMMSYFSVAVVRKILR